MVTRTSSALAVSAAALTALGCGAPPPDGLGPAAEGLTPCPATPNCVHTGHRHPEGTEPVYLDLGLSGAERIAGLQAVVESMPRTTVVRRTDDYLHAEARSLVFRFVDDLEFLVAPDGELVIRSASRLGRSDLGVNARRVEELRARLSEAGLLR